jgi:hypothetical protein
MSVALCVPLMQRSEEQAAASEVDATRHKVVTTRPRFEDNKEDFDQLADQWSGVVAKVEAAGDGKASMSLSECR